MSQNNQPHEKRPPNPLITQLLEDIQTERARVKRLKAKLLKYETPESTPPVQSLNLEKQEEKEKADDDDF